MHPISSLFDMKYSRMLIGLFIGALFACDTSNTAAGRVASRTDSVRADSIARARQDSINRASPGYVIDSVLPVEEELRRFRAAVGGTTATEELRHASLSRADLVRRFVRDLSTRDTTDLRRAVIDSREFADLVYPDSPNTRPPYRQSPAFVWMQIAGQSTSGLTRLLQRRGGQQLKYVGYACPEKPDVQGANRLWPKCVVRVSSSAGDTTTQRLFGTILERGGRFKFVSYANQF
jgi:hypothetical protein